MVAPQDGDGQPQQRPPGPAGPWTIPIRPAQCLAARTLLGWSHLRLAEAAGVSPLTIGRFENGRTPGPSILLRLRRALEAEGIEFIADPDGRPAVRLRPGAPRAG